MTALFPLFQSFYFPFFFFFFYSKLASVTLCIWHKHKISGSPLQGFTLLCKLSMLKRSSGELPWRRSDSPVLLCDQRQWVCGGAVAGLGCCPWRTTLLPFPVHQCQLPWRNSQYQMSGHLVTVVSCQIQQIRPHLAAHGWQIIGIGYGWNWHMCSAAGGWKVGWKEGGRIVNKSVADC